jgi:hypothetical protein
MGDASCGVQPTQTGPLEGALPPSLYWLVATQAGIADVHLTVGKLRPIIGAETLCH